MAEKEYIDREAAKYVLRERYRIRTNFHDMESAAQLKCAELEIGDIHAADVRPVVLCKDCKYWKQWDSTTHYLCTYVAGAKFIRNADDFCSRGEREES